MNIGPHDVQRFDDTIRARHAESLAHLAPRTRAQLQVRKRAALAGNATRAAGSTWRFAWPIAAAAAVGALAVGLQWRTAPEAAAPQVANLAAPAALDDTSAYTSLEENPDLYVWLASDGATLAME